MAHTVHTRRERLAVRVLTLLKRPALFGFTTWYATEVPPLDSPNIVTKDGSPPKEEMDFCTQTKAARWSIIP